MCKVAGCSFPNLAKGYCSGHYQRVKNGQPLDKPMRGRLTDEEFFNYKCPIRQPGECWLWTSPVDPKGYGRWRRGSKGAHRASYTMFVGPIPDGMTVDHTCFNPTCVNPEHLRLLTHSQNSANSRRALSETCGQGHPFSGANLYRYKDGRRGCRTCMQELGKAASARKKERRFGEGLSLSRIEQIRSALLEWEDSGRLAHGRPAQALIYAAPDLLAYIDLLLCELDTEAVA